MGRAHDTMVIFCEEDFGYLDCAVTGCCVDVVACYEEGVVRGDEDAGFVGEGIFFVFEEKFEGRIGAEDGLEAVVVDEERFHFVFLLGCLGVVEGIEEIG